jgi:probable F420-dependent oxidoreductase
VTATESTERPFRFGVYAGATSDLQAWRRLVRRTEDAGYSSLLVPDHLDQRWGPLVSLALAAAWTTRIALGTLMLAVDLRNPAVLCKELATLDQAAPGRLEIGLGAGWLATDFARAGVPMDSPGTRLARLDEAARLIRDLWDNDRVTHSGEHYSAVDAFGAPRPGPARWVMGGGGRRMLRTAVRHADIISLTAQLSSGAREPLGANASAARFDERVAWIREDAGDRFPDLELQCLLTSVTVTGDSAGHAERVLSPAFGLSPADVLESPVVLAGGIEEICERLRERRARFGIGYWVVPAARMEEFAPVVGRLADT